MNQEDVQKLSNAANAKITLLKNDFFKYFMRAIMAGFFIVVAMIFSNVVGNVFSGAEEPAWGKFLGALVFSIAVLLISLVGGELFTGDCMMLMGNLMQWKFRMPSIFKGALRSMTEKTVHEVCTKTVWKKDDVHKTAMTVRQYKERLGYSEQWMTEYVYNIVLLAKKEPKNKTAEDK